MMKRNFLSKLFQASLMCCLAVLFTGCEELLSALDNPIQTSLNMATSDVKLGIGEQKQRKATTASPATIVYASSDATVATVDANGVVTGVAEGEATITASVAAVDGWTAASASYKVIVEDTSSPSTPIVVTKSTPLTIEALEDGATVTFKALNSAVAKDIEYSKDDGATWTAGNTGGTGVSVVLAKVGGRVMFRGDNSSYATSWNDEYNQIDCDKNIKVFGNIMSLIQKTGFETLTTLSATNTFKKLFINNVNLIDASDLLLPAETLTDFCYNYMFSGCTNLTAAPTELPATTVAEDCCSYMFNGCTKLTTAPVELPATVMKGWCYSNMFKGCTSLTTAPKLPATTMANRCYSFMFYGCTSLNEVWVKVFDDGACYEMFTGCTNASTSTFHTDGDWNAWKTKFANINTWNNAAYTVIAKSTPLTIEALEDGASVTFYTVNTDAARPIEYSTDGGATWTAGSTLNPGVSVSLANAGDKVMFRGNNASYAQSGFYNEISCDKNFKVYGNIMSLIQKTGFETLTALTANQTFMGLFANKTKLIDASGLLLPAETLTNECYFFMFSNCSNLTTAPKLPATTLAIDCYAFMFSGCTNLAEAWVKAEWNSPYCNSMFNGVTATGKIHTSNHTTTNWTTNKPASWTVSDEDYNP